jgi:hypothetical protein
MGFDFPYRNNVLLFFSKEDKIFTQGLKSNLVSLMSEPKVVKDLKGGHLAMLQSMDENLSIVRDFLSEMNSDGSE